MKKFKKSYVILPALATMALTTVASVTGTVAWFSASRSVTVTASTFDTVTENSDLKVQLEQGEGTTVNNQAVTLAGDLTHGSYDAKNAAAGNAYVVDWEADATGATFKNLGTEASHTDSTTGASGNTNTNKWIANLSKKIYYAVSWKMTFSYESEDDTNYLLFDIDGAAFTDSVDGGQTEPALRIAFMTESKFIVLGGDSVVTHVSGEKTTTNYTLNENYFPVTTNTAKLVDGDSAISTSKLSFGTIKKNSNIVITCVAWYEGTDTAAITDKINEVATKMSSVNATLPFYVRNTVA